MAPDYRARYEISKDTIARSEAVTAQHSAKGATLDSTFIGDQLPPLDPASCPNHPSSPIELVNSDSFTAARNIIKRFPDAADRKVAVLNLASDELPGGGWNITLSKTQVWALLNRCYCRTEAGLGRGFVLLVDSVHDTEAELLSMAKYRSRKCCWSILTWYSRIQGRLGS